MITNNGIQMLKLMHLRKVLTAFEPIAGNIGEANKNALNLSTSRMPIFTTKPWKLASNICNRW